VEMLMRITLLLPFGGLVRSSNPLDIIRIESPSELYATVVHPQIELKTSDALGIKTNYFIEKCYYSMGKCGRTNSWFVHQRLRVDRTFLHDEIVEPLRSVLILALI
jgi:homoserine kinase